MSTVRMLALVYLNTTSETLLSVNFTECSAILYRCFIEMVDVEDSPVGCKVNAAAERDMDCGVVTVG